MTYNQFQCLALSGDNDAAARTAVRSLFLSLASRLSVAVHELVHAFNTPRTLSLEDNNYQQQKVGVSSCSDLERTTHIKYLEIIIDNRLGFHYHIFKSIKYIADINIIKMLYYALYQYFTKRLAWYIHGTETLLQFW